MKEKTKRQCILVVSDIHAPYSHPDTLAFLKAVKTKYRPTEVVLTGDECFPADAEILTESGFMRFDKLGDERVAQWNEDGSINFVTPIRKIIKPYTGNLLQYKHSTITSRTTPNHSLVKVDSEGKIHRREAWDSKGSESWTIPRCGKYSGQGSQLCMVEIQLMVAFQADGTFTKGAARFSFTKQRKIDRLLSLLNTANIPFNTHKVERGDTQFYIEKADVPSYFTKQFAMSLLLEMNLTQREVFLRELQEWDGTIIPGGFRYSSGIAENVEFVSALATTSGYVPSKIRTQNSCNYIDIRWKRENSSYRSAKKENIEYNGNVYCVTVPSRMIIVRQDGDVVVTGNCDYHALSFHDADPDLDSAGVELEKAIKQLEPIYELFPRATILESNHGSLVLRKAIHHGFPRGVFKNYNEILGAPKGWNWVNDCIIETSLGKVYFHHSRGPALKTSQLYGMSHVCGHLHESFCINYWSTPHRLLFSMTVGCLVDKHSLAMAYNKINLKRPIIGLGVIVDGIPELVPMILNGSGRWRGYL